jgi:hypothetical protein
MVENEVLVDEAYVDGPEVRGRRAHLEEQIEGAPPQGSGQGDEEDLR